MRTLDWKSVMCVVAVAGVLGFVIGHATGSGDNGRRGNDLPSLRSQVEGIRSTLGLPEQQP
jgi:hypothetical protein